MYPLLGLILATAAASPIGTLDNQLAIKFLGKYGYLDSGGGDAGALQAGLSEGRLGDVLREVQRFGNIPQTGLLDQDTLQLMSSKRCGLPDVVKPVKGVPDGVLDDAIDPDDVKEDTIFTNWPHHHNQHDGSHQHHHHHRRDLQNQTAPTHPREKRYILASRGWGKSDLSYHLENWPPGLGEGTVQRTMKTALDTWASHGGLRFSRSSDSRRADITFSFFAAEHGDSYPFDGRGGVLAHAFFPGGGQFEGDIHFDADEEWKVNMQPRESGVDLYTVALHELGHSLGLSHSPDDHSVMNPYYRGTSRELGLDDVNAMRALYGGGMRDRPPMRKPRPRPTTTPTTERPHPRPRPRPHPTTSRPQVEGESSWGGSEGDQGCSGNFDVVTLIRTELFIIKGKLLWRLRSPGKVQPNYPVDFHRFFYKLPEEIKEINAIYQRDHDSMIVIFTGPMYWVYDGTDFLEGSPRPITDYGLPSDVNRVDAVASRNNTAIIFLGYSYWLFDDLKRSPIPASPNSEHGSISDWGLNTPIDTAITYSDEYRDMVFVYGMCLGNAATAAREYSLRFPQRRTPDPQTIIQGKPISSRLTIFGFTMKNIDQ